MRYFVQVVDEAGNLTSATNKNQYYSPVQADASSIATGCGDLCVYLPLINR
ncbi:MAG: hypothetical protein U0175_23955 [Caldilineaceae bacterium]